MTNSGKNLDTPHSQSERPLCFNVPMKNLLRLVRGLSPAVLLIAAACEGTLPAPAMPDLARLEAVGPYVPAVTTVTLVDPARDRRLTVDVWYPAVPEAAPEAEAGFPVSALITDATRQALWNNQAAQAPHGGVTARVRAARGAASAEGPFPLVGFSHCMNCVRFSLSTVAARLASHGIAVVAPDHAGGTLFDDLLDGAEGLSDRFLATRAADVAFAVEAVAGGAPALPSPLRNRFDGSRRGVFGHSYGAATVGLVLQEYDAFQAGLAVAAPVQSPLFGSVSLERIEEPVLLLVAGEDNSITEIGNGYMRQNFEALSGPAWKVEVTDAGHWSFSDICGITPAFDAGCNPADTRQTDGREFDYIPLATAREIAAAYVTAFFLAELTGDADARAYLETARPPERVGTLSRNP